MFDDLVPFFTYNDLYLKPIYKVVITVALPKLRQMGQSVSNWEIRERLKKMLKSIEVSDFKVLESSLEEVQFAAIVNNYSDCRKVSRTLNGVSFRAIGFTEPLTVTVTRGKLEFPTRVDWDKFFSDNAKTMSESNPGERPDTIYIGGLPFEWFKNSRTASYEEMFKEIFSTFGEVRRVDIPQCDPLRREMNSELSGIRLSVWSFGEHTFFEAYIQFKEYAGFQRAMETLSGKVLAQKIAKGQLREAQIKVDFDRTAHLSTKKIEQREAQRKVVKCKTETQKTYSSIMELVASTPTTATPSTVGCSENLPSTSAVVSLPPPPVPPTPGDRKSARTTSSKNEAISNHTMKRREKEIKRQKAEKLARRLMRAEKRHNAKAQKNRELELREKLKSKLTERLKCTKAEREIGAKALLLYIANLHWAKVAALQQTPVNSNHPLESDTKEDFFEDEKLREELLQKRELNLRNRIAERMLHKTL